MSEGQGAFEILEIPAVGAYGAVVVARQTEREGRVVALKVLKSDHLGRHGILKRTRDEARLLFRLRHPNIVRVEELIDVGGRPVLVMEWVEGASIRDLVDQDRRLPLPVALEVARLAAGALDAAHNTLADGRPMRIVHRDLKPSNLLMSLAGELKVVDFGIAHGDFDARETDTGSTIMGTQGYMAPERLHGISDDPAIDVYGLGVTLFEMLTGQCLLLPGPRARHDESLAHATTRMAQLHPSDVGRGTSDLVRRMCLWDHGHRPSIAELREELSALLLGAGTPDLAAWALQRVVPLHTERRRTPKEQHPEYPELRFLEQPWTVKSGPPADAGTEDIPVTYVHAENTADQRLRRFLASADWSSRMKELTWLLATNHAWTERPFLEVLDRAGAPWWRVWTPRAKVEDVVAAVNMLRYRRTPEVLQRVEPLARHADVRIARTARALLDDTGDAR